MLSIRWLGRVAYRDGLALQRALYHERAQRVHRVVLEEQQVVGGALVVERPLQRQAVPVGDAAEPADAQH